jgi:hypothetical protein
MKWIPVLFSEGTNDIAYIQLEHVSKLLFHESGFVDVYVDGNSNPEGHVEDLDIIEQLRLIVAPESAGGWDVV